MNSPILTALLILAAGATPSFAGTYYVATDGSDSASGAQAAPWKTIAHAVRQMNAGDTTYVKGGVYNEKLIRFRKSGTASAPIKLLNAPGESPVVHFGVGKQEGVSKKDRLIHRFEIQSGAGATTPIGWITIEGFEIKHGYDGIKFMGAHDITIRRNWIHHVTSQGILGSGKNVVIDRNTISRNGDSHFDHGLYLSGSDYLISNNLIYGNATYGIQVAGYAWEGSTHYKPMKGSLPDPSYTGASNFLIANNTFAYQGSAGIVIWQAAAVNARVVNNIFYENGVTSRSGNRGVNGVDFLGSGNGHVLNNNLFFASGSGGTRMFGRADEGVHYTQSGNITTDPNFANAGETLSEMPDFHLKTGSPAIDKGLTLPEVILDRDDTARHGPSGGAHDIGAYEHGSPPIRQDNSASPAPAKPGMRDAASESPFPVRASANGRHLVDASGKPFLLHGDTAWSLMVQLTKEETEAYLENRRQKGFNAVLVLFIVNYLSDNPPMNKNGDAPFTTADDFSTPNEAYFAHVEWVIRKAREKGILLILNPCVTGTASNKVGFKKAIIANGATKCREYGRYIGSRFKDHPNIIWQAVGDQTPPAGQAMEKNWLEILQGIKELAPNHDWTAHYTRRSTALDAVAFAPHMTLDNAYGGNRSYIQTLRAYNRANPKPTFYNEGYYEDTGLGSSREVGKPQMLRAQAYWALLSGATGHIFGSDHIWPFGGPFSGPGGNQRWDWRAGMDRQPSRETAFVKRLFESLAWHELIPDQDHSVVTKGYGTFGKDDRTPGGDYVAAARTPDGRLVMAYVPATKTGTRTITVNMARLSGPAKARWYNPTSGTFTDIAGSPFANSGPREFTTPGDNGTGTNDWVLVLEVHGKGDER